MISSNNSSSSSGNNSIIINNDYSNRSSIDWGYMIQRNSSSSLAESSETVDSVILYHTYSGAEVSLSYFLACILTLLVAIWIIFLNKIIVSTLIHHKRSIRVSDYFVSVLSIADLVTGLTLIYITTYSLIQYQNMWECLFRFGLTYTVSQSSNTHLLAVTINRYIKIIYPLHYEVIFTKGRVLSLSVAIWIFSIIIGLLPLFGWHNKFWESNVETETVCRFFGVLPDSYFLTNILISSVMMLITVALYAQIAYIARQQYRLIHSRSIDFTTSTSTLFDEHAWKLAKTIGIVVVVSNLCWVPGVIVILLHVTGMLDSLTFANQGDLITYCSVFVFLNSLINPLIYAVKIDKVNKRFRHMFCCKHYRNIF